MIDRNELKRLAQAATPGPWEVHTTPKGPIVTSEDRQFEIAICGVDADVFSGKDFGQENAALIAAANPQAVLELVERLRNIERDFDRLAARVRELEALLNTPEIEDFDTAVPLEAAHQQLRWGSEHDVGKQPEDWFWLLGYLAGKALASCRGGNLDKAKHHCISSAAALRNWHAHLRSGATRMRPGIDEPTAIKEAQDE